MESKEEVYGQYLGEVDRGWVRTGVITLEVQPEVLEWLNSAIIEAFEGGVDSVCLIWQHPEGLGRGLHLGVEVTGLAACDPSRFPKSVKTFAVEKVQG